MRASMQTRFGGSAPSVASAGVAGWEGSGADPHSVTAAAEVGVDISRHRGRRLDRADVEDAVVVIAMAGEHASAVVDAIPGAHDRTFTLKELVRLLEATPAPVGAEAVEPTEFLSRRIAAANALRASGFEGNPYDDDVADPLGLPVEAFRAMTWELGEWVLRLEVALFGVADPARAAGGG